MFKWIEVIKLVLIILSCILLYKLIKSSKISLEDYATNKVDNKLKKIPIGYFNHERLEKYLIKMGDKATPAQFIMIKFELSIILLIIGIQFGNVILGVGLAIIGFCFPDKRLKKRNDKDNEKILKDLQRVYDVLRIETKSGVHITDAISECYLVARNRRLKEGLLILSNELNTQKDIQVALQNFNNKFNNPYIDSFCIIIKQSLETGKTIQILEDLSEQISDIDEATYLSEEEEITDRGDKRLFLIYALNMFTMLYGVFLMMTKSIMKF